MNRIWTACLLVIAILMGCSQPLPPTRVDERFTDDVLIKTTPVKKSRSEFAVLALRHVGNH